MFSKLHSRLGTAGFIISIVALVAALGGGAYAASGGLTGKQKKEVEKIAKKYAGKPGVAGAQGPAGAKGDTGSAGANGTSGSNGTAGTNGSNGKGVEVGNASVSECAEGGATVQIAGEVSTKKHVCNGSAWTAGGTLPEEESETGTWAGQIEAPEFVYSPISFTIPLAAPLDENHVIVVPQGNLTTGHCSASPVNGSAAEPKADPGYLCVYRGASSPQSTQIAVIAPSSGNAGADTSGTAIVIEGPAGNSEYGTWAVTAP